MCVCVCVWFVQPNTDQCLQQTKAKATRKKKKDMRMELNETKKKIVSILISECDLALFSCVEYMIACTYACLSLCKRYVIFVVEATQAESISHCLSKFIAFKQNICSSVNKI